MDLPTSAVHFELTSELTTSAYLAALDRMIARRGRCSDIYCDNATTYHGAENELKRFENQWKEGEFQEEIAKRKIRWHYIVPYMKSTAGIWESQIRRLRHHFNRESYLQTFTYEELNTAFVRIEACMNSRPLGKIMDVANEPTPITPSHFLANGPTVLPLGPRVAEIPPNRLDSWERIHKFEQNIWNRWSKEYLCELQRRQKWRKDQPNLEIDDLVLIQEDNVPPGEWKKGIVVQTYPGKDGKVRSVKIRVEHKRKTYDRPITKLCRLPIDEEIWRMDNELIEQNNDNAQEHISEVEQRTD